MSDLERVFLEDTYAILYGYDGHNSPEGLKGLIDEAMERIQKVLSGNVVIEDTGLYVQHVDLET